MKKKKNKQKPLSVQTIRSFVKNLNDHDSALLDDYIEYEYVPKVRTGKGKRINFYKEHDSPEGIEIIKELLKFKRLVFKNGLL